jgi:hypothetical protein
MSRLEGSRGRLRRAREMRPAMEFEWVFFRLLFGPNVNAGSSKAAEKRRSRPSRNSCRAAPIEKQAIGFPRPGWKIASGSIAR